MMPRILSLAAVALAAASADVRAQEAAPWSDRIDLRALFKTQAAFEIDDGDAQKADVVLIPELTANLSDTVRLTAIGRFRFDPVDELEPGQPDNDTRSAISRRYFVGEATDIELREFYADVFLENAFLRIGKQQIVWGQADGLRVLDLVNPLHYREFILPSFEDRRIPLWTVNAEIPIDDFLLQLLWIPDRTYDDLPEPGSPFAFSTPLLVPTPAPGIPVTLRDPERPDDPIADSDVGVRLSAFLGGWDLSLNYLYHYYDQAVLFRETTATGVVVTPRYERSHLIGGTFSNVFGDVTLRGEAGLSLNRHVLTDAPGDADGVVRTDEFGYVLGLDYNGISDTLISAQFFQSILTDHPEGVVRDRVDNQATFLVRRDFLNQTVTAEGLLIHSLNNGDGVLQLDLAYDLRSNVILTLGADVFYGSRDGLFGEFKDAGRVTFGVEIGL